MYGYRSSDIYAVILLSSLVMGNKIMETHTFNTYTCMCVSEKKRKEIVKKKLFKTLSKRTFHLVKWHGEIWYDMV